MRRTTIVLLAALTAAGCPGPERITPSPSKPVISIDNVTLFVTPPAVLNWDDKPGPDGVRIAIFCFQKAQGISVTVSGSLEVQLYEQNGDKSMTELEKAAPFQTWSFSAQELPRFLVRADCGWGYAIQLGWGDHVPTSDKISLRARYKSPSGEVVYSDPLTMPMSLK